MELQIPRALYFFIGTLVLPMLPFFPTLLGLWEICRDEKKKNLRILVRKPTFFSERELQEFCRDEKKKNLRILVRIRTFFSEGGLWEFCREEKEKNLRILMRNPNFFSENPVDPFYCIDFAFSQGFLSFPGVFPLLVGV